MKKLLFALVALGGIASSAECASDAEFPATTSFRKALTGRGYVLVVNTTVKEDILAKLTVTSPSINATSSYKINLSWKHKNEFGPLEGIKIYPGDEIILE